MFDLVPYRPEVVHFLSSSAWATWEIWLAMIVMFLSFAQRKYDSAFSGRNMLGMLSYIWLVVQATFALSVLFDGMYIAAHWQTEEGRPIVCGSMVVIMIQQLYHLIPHAIVKETMKRCPIAPVELDAQAERYNINFRAPQWVLFLVDTSWWFTHLRIVRAILNRLHHHSPVR